MPKVFVEPIGLTLTVDEQDNLLEGLVRAQIDIPTDCAGRGTCGKCLVRLGSGELTAPTERELKRIPEKLRDEGWRLACQAYSALGARQHRGARHRGAAADPHDVAAHARRRAPGGLHPVGAARAADAGRQALGPRALRRGPRRRRGPAARARGAARHPARRQVEGDGDPVRQARHRRPPRRARVRVLRRGRRHRDLQGHRLPVRPAQRRTHRPGGHREPADALRRGRDQPHRPRLAAQRDGAAGGGRPRGHQHQPQGAVRASGRPPQPRLRHDRGRQHRHAPPRPRPLSRRPRPGAVRARRRRAPHAARRASSAST